MNKRFKRDKSLLQQGLEKDESEIKFFEKKLGMKVKKNTFYKDGLGDLLDFCDEKDNKNINYEEEYNDELPEEISQSEFQFNYKRKKNEKNKTNNSENEDKDEEISENESLNEENFDEDYSDNFDENSINDNEEDSIVSNDQIKLKYVSEKKLDKPKETGKWVSKRMLENKKKFEENQKKKNVKDNHDDDFEDEINYSEDDNFDEDEFSENNEEDFSDNEFSSDEFDTKKLNKTKKDNDKKTKKNENDSNEDDIKEDIYGNIINKKGKVLKEKVVTKSFNFSQNENELTLKIRGLMNRLELKTLAFVFEELEKIFQKHSNNLICSCLINCIDQLIIKDELIVSQKLNTEISMLLAICHSRIGEEISANILHELILKLDKLMTKLSNNKVNLENKEMDNLVIFLCSLYSVNIISDELIYNILEKLTNIFNSKSIELILFILKLVGSLLRKDNTSMMKSFIINVQIKANNFDKNLISEKKVLFMLNALTSIKNNVNLKMDLTDIQTIIPLDKQKIKNDLKNCFKDLNVSSLKGKYNEILKSNRWFVHSGELLEISMKRKIEKQNELKIPNLSEKLCKKLKLTTPFRKLIFNTILTCEDYIDCSQNLIKLTKKNHFEIILICIHICLNEKKFNSFYAHLFRYLAHIDRNYKRGILFNLREKIKNINDIENKTNLEKLIVELIKLNILPLIVFDVMDFKDMNEIYKKFMYNILEELFKQDLVFLNNIFKNLPKKNSLSTSIRVFINIFLSDESKEKMKSIKLGNISNKIF